MEKIETTKQEKYNKILSEILNIQQENGQLSEEELEIFKVRVSNVLIFNIDSTIENEEELEQEYNLALVESCPDPSFFERKS